MARARNIKPGFFQNEELAEIPFEGRLLFIGLWTLCDAHGKMEWRPKKVKALLFPYDNVNVLVLAQELHRAGLVTLYTVDNIDYLKVVTFRKHQHPHVNEKPMGYPEPDQSNCLFDIGSSASIVQATDISDTAKVPIRPLTDSLLLKTDYSLREGDDQKNEKVSQKIVEQNDQPKTKGKNHATAYRVQFGEGDVQCPADFANDASRLYGFEQQRIDACWQHFSDHHRAKASRFADWRAAFRTWCRNDVRFSERDSNRGQKPRSNYAAALAGAISDRQRRHAAEGVQHRHEGNPPSGADAGRTPNSDELLAEAYGLAAPGTRKPFG